MEGITIVWEESGGVSVVATEHWLEGTELVKVSVALSDAGFRASPLGGDRKRAERRGELGPCAGTGSAVPVPNLVPASFCRVPAAVPAAVEPVEEKHITRGLVGMFFETDKTFLLPSAMRSIRRLNQFYKDNPCNPCIMLRRIDSPLTLPTQIIHERNPPGEKKSERRTGNSQPGVSNVQ